MILIGLSVVIFLGLLTGLFYFGEDDGYLDKFMFSFLFSAFTGLALFLTTLIVGSLLTIPFPSLVDDKKPQVEQSHNIVSLNDETYVTSFFSSTPENFYSFYTKDENGYHRKTISGDVTIHYSDKNPRAVDVRDIALNKVWDFVYDPLGKVHWSDDKSSWHLYVPEGTIDERITLDNK